MEIQEVVGYPVLPKAVLENIYLLKAEMLLKINGTRQLSNLPI